MSLGSLNLDPGWSKNRQLIDLLGASLLGAIGSLPLHLAPLVISALITSTPVSLHAAGLIVSAAMIGQLCSASLLPMLGIAHVGRTSALTAAFVMCVGVLISSLPYYHLVALGWFLIGLACGVFRYLSALSASAFPKRHFAFVFRLSVVLILVSVVFYLLMFFGSTTSYKAFAWNLELILAVMLVLGLLLYRPLTEQALPAMQSHSPHRGTAHPQILGLIVIMAFFVGQVGFLSYVVQLGLKRGFEANDVIMALTAMKFIAGIWLLCIILRRRHGDQGTHLLGAALALIAAIASIYYGQGRVLFFGGLLVLEIALNMMSARLQATVVVLNSRVGGKWITIAVLGGAAIGAPLNGLAISTGHAGGFVVFTIATILAALLWKQFFANVLIARKLEAETRS